MKTPFVSSLKGWLVAICFICTYHSSFSQNAVVTGAVAGNGSYATLKAAFDAINLGTQTGANILITIVANTTETASAVLNAGAWANLSIEPNNFASFTISGNIAGPLVDLNGADNVLINGYNTGGTYLTLSNTNTGNSTTLRFVNDAINNLVMNCSLLGSSTSAAMGVVTFSTGTTTGNNGNSIISTRIGPAGTNLPLNSVYSSGSSGADNTNNIFSGNQIYDYFSSASASAGMVLAANSNSWTITANSFCQTASRTYGTANTHRAILISAGNAHKITDNRIGFSPVLTATTYAMASTVATRFVAIDLAVGTLTATSVQGNTIAAITLSTSSNAGTANGILCGINVTAGNVNIGTTNGNLIGATTGTGSIRGMASAAGALVVGINCSSTGTIAIQANYMGGISSSGTVAANSGAVTGINISGIPAFLSMTGNTIGNATADNIRGGTSGLTTGASVVSGINLSSTPAGTVLIANNLIRNMASYGTGTGYVRGIWTAAAQSVTTTYSVVSNSISNLVSNSGLTTISNGQTGAAGMNIATGNNNVIASNTISGVALTGTTALMCYAAGITHANATSSSIYKNLIYNITNASTSTASLTPGIAAGIAIRSGLNDIMVYNNMISLGSGATDNTSFIGIQANNGSSPNPLDKIYFNTIYISGTANSGALSSFGFLRGDFTTTRTAQVDFRNNLIVNTRSGGSGLHYAIGDNYGIGSSTQGWSVGASNYNVLNAATGNVGWWNSSLNLAGWKLSTGCDFNSFSGIPVTVVNSANDLHLNMGPGVTSIESGGQLINGFTTDFDNQVRPGPAGSTNGGGLFPDIGADEIDAAPGTCTTASSGNIAGGSSYTACSGQILTAIAPNASYALGTTYQWQVGATAGGPYSNITAGSGMTTISHTSAPLPAGVYYVVLKTTCSSATITSLSNEVMLTVNTTPTVTASSASTVLCSGQNFSLSGSPGSATTFMWKGPNAYSTTVQNPTLTSASINATGNYSFMSVVNSCTSAPAIVSVTVNATPTTLTLSPVNASICPNGSQTLTVIGGDVPGGVMNFTPNTNQNGPTTYPAPYSVYWGGQKMQFLILASELTAAGIIAGPLTSISFPVASKGSSWGVSMNSCENFQMSAGLTAANAIGPNFLTGLTVVSQTNYTPTVGFNTHYFSPTFVWDGSSNVVIETAFSNNITGSSNDAVISYNSPTTFQSTLVYRADGVSFASIAAATTSNEPVGLVRPDFIIRGQMPGTYTWSPVASLSASSGSFVTATPSASTIYTVTVAAGSCSAKSSATVTILPTPSVTVVSTPTAICTGGSATLTASGGTNYIWSTGVANTNSVIVSPGISTTYILFDQSSPCAAAAVSINMNVNPLPTLNVFPSSATVCALSPASFTASGGATYSWSSGSASSTETIYPPSSGIYTVVGTSSLGCSSSKTIAVTTKTLPLVQVAPAATSVCDLSSVSFTASGALNYSWSTGQQSAIETVTVNGSGNYTVTGSNLQGCSASKVVTLTALDLPVLNTTPASGTICAKESVVLSADGASTYTWSYNNTAASSITVSPNLSTNYQVTGTGTNNCKSTQTVTIVVKACTGIEERSLEGLVELYPNPSNGKVYLRMSVEGQKEIELFGPDGAYLGKTMSEGHEQSIDLSEKAKGLYLVRVRTKDASGTYRIVLE